jgi:hypothetical protein
MAELRHKDDICEVWQGDAREVVSSMADGSCSLAILDGPYAMGKADWDRQGLDGLPEWYRPHLEDVGRVCAPSASLYVWNTAAGWARLDPLIRSMGWTFRALVTWDKTIASLAGKGVTANRTWPSVTETCGFYQREEWAPSTCAGSEIANAAGADERNWVRLWLGDEWAAAGLKRRQADEAMGTNGMAGHYFGSSQWSLPTWEAYQQLAEYAAEHGASRERPYLVHPSIWPGGGLRDTYDHLRAEYDHLRAEYDHLRAEYEASRPPFECPMGVGNVWTHGPVAGRERLRADNGATLHPCQKPVLFARRMIEASTRPGDRVWVPFGGTLRECVAARDIARESAESARYVVTSELNGDGPDYIGAALRQYHGEGTRPVDPRQGRMFG